MYCFVDLKIKSFNRSYLYILFNFIYRRYDQDPDNAWNACSWCEYMLIVILSTILLVGVLILTLFWVMYYRDGLGWSDNAQKQFNLHPFLMIAGYITLSGFCKFPSLEISFEFTNLSICLAAILLYRLCRCLKHIYVKLIHMFFHGIAIPCIALGFLAVLDSHNTLGKEHFYTLHSWLGLATMGMFAMQFVVGFFTWVSINSFIITLINCDLPISPQVSLDALL